MVVVYSAFAASECLIACQRIGRAHAIGNVTGVVRKVHDDRLIARRRVGYQRGEIGRLSNRKYDIEPRSPGRDQKTVRWSDKSAGIS